MADEILTDDQVRTLAQSFLAARGQSAFDAGDLMKIVRWAERISLERQVLDLVLEGSVGVDITDEGIRFALLDESLELPGYIADLLLRQHPVE